MVPIKVIICIFVLKISQKLSLQPFYSRFTGWICLTFQVMKVLVLLHKTLDWLSYDLIWHNLNYAGMKQNWGFKAFLEIDCFFQNISRIFFCCTTGKLSLIKIMISVGAYHAEGKFRLNRINNVYLVLSGSSGSTLVELVFSNFD